MTLEQRVERLAGRVHQLNAIITNDKYRDLVTGLWLEPQDSGDTTTPQKKNNSSGDGSAASPKEKKDSDPRSPDELRQKFKDSMRDGNRLRVGIIGRVKAGKSSLLNALLFDGKDVLPKAATPMTASLTVLAYAETPYAEVEFFDQADVENMRQRAQDYELEFERRVKEKLEKTQARPSKFGAPRAQAVPDPARVQAMVRRDLDGDPTLGGSKKLFDDIQRAGGVPSTPRKRIDAENIQALLDELADYVGVNGKYTPITKCMSIYLPLEPLKDLEVVDTPGVNDPIVSREKRTFDELHKCHAVFVVSPSGQFLNDKDLELMQRLVKHDGVEEVFLVASQIDGQLFGSEFQRYEGSLPSVLQGLRQTLAQQARSTVPQPEIGGKGLMTLKRELDTRLVVTSSVAYTLASQPESAWDENVRHIHGMLRSSYPNEFAQSQEAARPHYDSIAGIAQTQALLDEVRERRQTIIESNLQAFLDAQEQVLQQRLKDIPIAISRQRTKVETMDGGEAEQQLAFIRQASKKGARVVDTAVGAIAQNVAANLCEHMDAMVEQVLDELRRTAERAKGTTTRSYRTDSGGIFGSVKRGLGWLLGQDDWGTERYTKTLNTINAAEIRTVLEKVHTDLQRSLTGTVGKARQGLRPVLESTILRELREKEVVNDRDIDITILGQCCQNTMAQLRDFDEPELPPLPDALIQSGKLEGGAADRFEADAMAYFQKLQKAARAVSRELTHDFETRLGSAEIGANLFQHYQEKIQELKQQIKDKAQTLERYDNLLAEIKGLK